MRAALRPSQAHSLSSPRALGRAENKRRAKSPGDPKDAPLSGARASQTRSLTAPGRLVERQIKRQRSARRLGRRIRSLSGPGRIGERGKNLCALPLGHQNTLPERPPAAAEPTKHSPELRCPKRNLSKSRSDRAVVGRQNWGPKFPRGRLSGHLPGRGESRNTACAVRQIVPWDLPRLAGRRPRLCAGSGSGVATRERVTARRAE